MNDDRRRAIVAEVAKWAASDDLEWWQFTTKDYMTEKNIGHSRAQAQLQKWVAEGRLRSQMITHGGKKTRAYSRPEDEPTKT